MSETKRVQYRLLPVVAAEGLACSEKAASVLFGPRYKQDFRWQVLPCGLDFSPFHSSPDSHEVRRELGIPDDAQVVGHVGRFFEQKNHEFIVRIARELVRKDPRIHILFVGDGPLRPHIEQKVAEAQLEKHVTFAGVRGDVPRLMLGVTDVFLFPSLYEGLGLVLVEA